MPKVERRPATRGEQKFASITYSLLVEWTGLSLETIRSYGAKGVFNKNDLESTMRWVNDYRAKKNLPPIGMPRTETGEG